MATTTATVTISSADLTGDSLALSQTSTLTKAEVLTGMSQTTGVARRTFNTATSDYVLFSSSDYTSDKAHKLYVRNMSSTAAESVTLTVGTQNVGVLYANDWAFLPWSASADFKVSTSDATMTIEYMLIFE